MPAQVSQFKRLFYSKIAVGVLLILAVALSVPVWGMYERYSESERRLTEKRSQQAELQDRNELLQERIDHLESDRGVEAELRRQFNAALEGERMVVLVEDEDMWSEFETESNHNDRTVWEQIKAWLEW